MEFDELALRHIKLDMKYTFETSFDRISERNLLILEGKKDGKWFYGEASPLQDPVYNHESTFTVKEVISRYVVEALKNSSSIEDYHERLSSIKGHNLAKASGDQLIYHKKSVEERRPISELIGGEKDHAECGIVLGVTEKDELVDKVQKYVDKGYKRLKMKIKPGRDLEHIRIVRNHFPNLEIMADANSAYTLDDVERLKKLDQFDLSMIEQPLGDNDIVNHSILAEKIETPICLDESIHSAKDVKRAARIDACEIINLKPQRVSGLHESKKINEICKENGLDLWIGSLVESGLGQSVLVIASSLSEVAFPGDIASSDKYYERDIIKPEIKVKNGRVKVPEGPGFVGEVDREKLKEKTVEHRKF